MENQDIKMKTMGIKRLRTLYFRATYKDKKTGNVSSEVFIDSSYSNALNYAKEQKDKELINLEQYWNLEGTLFN